MRNILVIPDLHIPFEHKHALSFCKRIYKDLNCSEVIHIGDLVDNHAISYHEHDPNGLSPEQEIKLSLKKCKDWYKAFPQVKLCRGNHDCNQIDTEFLTSDGWKTYKEWRGEKIAQFDIGSMDISFSDPINVIEPHMAETVVIEGFHTKQVVSINHDVVTSLGLEYFRKMKSSELLGRILDANEIPTSGQSETRIDISDFDLRLCIWLICDGTLVISSKNKKRLQFKLSNEDKISKLIKLLSSNGCDFTYRKAKMCSTNKLQPYYITVYGKKAREISEILHNKKELPREFSDASSEQMEIILSSMLSTDASISGNRITMVSISKYNLDILQEIFIRNGYCAKVSNIGFRSGFSNGKEQYLLTIYRDLASKNIGKIRCTKGKEDLVFGFEMPMGTMITRHSGKIAFTGNCLVDRKGKTNGLPSRVFRPFREIWDLPKGWIDDWEFVIDNVKYVHGTGYSGKTGHIQAAVDNRMSCVIGHIHSACGVNYVANNIDMIFGMNVGCLIDRKAYAFAYGKDFRNKPILACGVVSYTKRGINATIYPMQL